MYGRSRGSLVCLDYGERTTHSRRLPQEKSLNSHEVESSSNGEVLKSRNSIPKRTLKLACKLQYLYIYLLQFNHHRHIIYTGSNHFRFYFVFLAWLFNALARLNSHNNIAQIVNNKNKKQKTAGQEIGIAPQTRN